MSCEYCCHEGVAYEHHKDEQGRDVYARVATPLMYDDGAGAEDAEPMISWAPEDAIAIDYADHAPRLCVTAYNQDGDEICIAIPIIHCPICGRRLPTCKEVYA